MISLKPRCGHLNVQTFVEPVQYKVIRYQIDILCTMQRENDEHTSLIHLAPKVLAARATSLSASLATNTVGSSNPSTRLCQPDMNK